MENYKIVLAAASGASDLPKHKAFMICATDSAATAPLTFYGTQGGESATITIRVPADDTLVLPLQVKDVGTLANCTCYMLD
jgi:hypothetical protein